MRGILAAGLLLGLASAATASAPPPSPRFVLDELLREYRHHGMPLLPKGTKLVRYTSTPGYLPDRYDWGRTKPGLGLLVRGKNGTRRIYTGENWWDLNANHPTPREVNSPMTAIRKYPRDATLIFAVQCHSMGWTELAEAIVTEWRKPHVESCISSLRSELWGYWQWQIPKEGSAWKEIAKRLKALLALEKSLGGWAGQHLITALEIALKPRKTKPGSVESLIEEVMMQPASRDPMGLSARAESARKLIEFGFKAVPALIARLEDKGMTRHVMQAKRVTPLTPAWNMRVQHVVSDLLEQIAGQTLDRDHPEVGGPVKKADALRWWDRAQEVGEETYIVRRVLTKDGDLAVPQLRIIAAKYSKHLDRLYKNVLIRYPKKSSWDLAEAVAESTLQRKEKRALLCWAAKGNNLAHRRAALFYLVKLDRPFVIQMVGKSLKQLPKDVKSAYGECEEAGFGHLAGLLDDVALWKQLKETTSRSSVGLRMELLHNAGLAVKEKKSARRTRYLAFMASFLDDKAGRELKADKRYDECCAGWAYENLSVRDLVAMEMAPYLNLKVADKPDRTAKEWAQLREQVRKAWKREQQKDRGPLQ